MKWRSTNWKGEPYCKWVLNRKWIVYFCKQTVVVRSTRIMIVLRCESDREVASKRSLLSFASQADGVHRVRVGWLTRGADAHLLPHHLRVDSSFINFLDKSSLLLLLMFLSLWYSQFHSLPIFLPHISKGWHASLKGLPSLSIHSKSIDLKALFLLRLRGA